MDAGFVCMCWRGGEERGGVVDTDLTHPDIRTHATKWMHHRHWPMRMQRAHQDMAHQRLVSDGASSMHVPRMVLVHAISDRAGGLLSAHQNHRAHLTSC